MATRATRPDAAAVEENFSGEKKQACSPTNSTMMVMSVPDEAFKGDLGSACSMEAVRQRVQESSPWSQASWVSGASLSLINYVARSIMPSGP